MTKTMYEAEIYIISPIDLVYVNEFLYQLNSE